MLKSANGLVNELAGSTNYGQFIEQLFLIGCFCLGAIFFLYAVFKGKQKKWRVAYFLLLCIFTSVWALGNFVGVTFGGYRFAAAFAQLRYWGPIFIPSLLCLHIWEQASYREITPPVWIFWLSVPVFLSAVLLQRLFSPEYSLPVFYLFGYRWEWLLYHLFSILALGRAVLICFNVLYQTPRHMRRVPSLFFGSIAVFIFALVAGIAFPVLSRYHVPLLCAVIMLVLLQKAFKANDISNVIITSRDFLFPNLSTAILVLDPKQLIIDWNIRKDNALSHLPIPVYRESLENYRARFIKAQNGRVSPHGENVITTVSEGKEHHYLITTREARNRVHQFGYIVEIAEITGIYTFIRYLEDIATMDQLTGLYNRNSYLNVVHKLATPESMPLVVIVGDVNNLKKINDTNGHLKGDSLLIACAEMIKKSARRGIFIARIGGDEFVLLQPKGTAKDAEAFIERANLACQNTQDEDFGQPSISWGYAIMESCAQDYNEVFAKADEMMYSFKRANFTSFRSSGFVPIETP
ncbi:MAG: diguanylate cyclase domain-containing protein, partial [Oscillospiraceae bacterium]